MIELAGEILKTSFDIASDITGKTNAAERAVLKVLDAVQGNKAAKIAFESLIVLPMNEATVHRNEGMGITIGAKKDNWQRNLDLATHIAKLGEDKKNIFNKTLSALQKALVEPNVGGIPISCETISVSRDVDISEQMVIVQSAAQKKYWTDNAVPRLKEWQLEGYLTSLDTGIDYGYLVKPTLKYQKWYLDTVASSRRPVVFKTNDGEFVDVQIVNLQFSEEASYNNAVKVSCTLKEYNPYISGASMQTLGIAEKALVSELGNKGA